MAITPTTITTEEQIYLTGSPINIFVQNANADSTIQKALIELYIWNGNLNAPPATPTKTLTPSKVSKTDTKIYIQIAEILASYINQTKFSWTSGNSAPSIAGEGIFFQLKYTITNENGSVETAVERPTNFATQGYRLDYEQIGTETINQTYNGLVPINYNRNYTERISYYKRSFDFTKTLEECTSENIIKSEQFTPSKLKCQLGDAYLIVYINRLGLFDYCTTYGKAVKSTDVDSDTNPRLYRNPNAINNNVNHSKIRQINQTPQNYTINTGDLHESMTDQIEEVMMSPLIYLIEFNGDTFTVTNVGLTVDSTTVTVDSTVYTVDNQTITEEDLGFFSTFKQIPVTNTNKNFTKKTRRNDKGKINYDLSFEVTMDRINNLR